MDTFRIAIYDPQTRHNRLFWVSMLEEDIDAETESLAILQALTDFCKRGGIAMLEADRLHITCTRLDSAQIIPIVLPGGNA